MLTKIKKISNLQMLETGGVCSASLLRNFCFKTKLNYAQDFHFREKWSVAFGTQANLGLFLCLKLKEIAMKATITSNLIKHPFTVEISEPLEKILDELAKLKLAVYGIGEYVHEVLDDSENTQDMTLGLYLIAEELQDAVNNFAELLGYGKMDINPKEIFNQKESQ